MLYCNGKLKTNIKTIADLITIPAQLYVLVVINSSTLHTEETYILQKSYEAVSNAIIFIQEKMLFFSHQQMNHKSLYRVTDCIELLPCEDF